MKSQDNYKQGDPRRVLAISKKNSNQNQSPEEFLWGCKDYAESLRMSRIIVGGGFLTLTLNERGTKSFAFLRDASPGIREAYFISYFQMGAITGAPMLLGQFLFEFEKYPENALRLYQGNTNRIYFRKNGSGEIDGRIDDYELLTKDETANVRSRLQALASKQEQYQEIINRLIATLNK